MLFRKPTVFVLGAGASAEFGFPQGTGLVKEIQTLMTWSQDDWGHLTGPGRQLFADAIETFGTQKVVFDAAKQLCLGLAHFKSIDDFLDQRQGDEVLIQVAKSAIAQIILSHEKASPLSSLHANRSLSVAGLTKTWLAKLIRMAIQGVPLSQLQSVFKNVTFISFNYDRSLEQFLVFAISEAWGIPLEQSNSLIANVAIHHVYGSLGKLYGFGSRPIQFGATLLAPDVRTLSQSIRTYTETVDDVVEAKTIRDAIAKAEKIVFLGCGFHRQNIDILVPAHLKNSGQVVATTFGVSNTDLESVRKRIASLYRPSHMSPDNRFKDSLHGMTCTELFDECAMSLTE